MNTSKAQALGPTRYALIGFAVWPLFVLGGAILLLAMIVLWPFSPFVLYRQRRNELQEFGVGEKEGSTG